MLYLLLLSYVAVFTGELMGDKLLYTISTLATRYRLLPMLGGVAVAFMGKMLAAVLLGGFVSHLPGKLVAVLSAATYFTMALAPSVKTAAPGAADSRQLVPSFRAVVISFSVVFFSEWGDIGQITAATLAARYHAPLVIWMGGTLAMVTKSVLAMTVGVALRSRISQEVLRYCGVCVLFGLGVLSLINIAVQW
jgi:Ca2+/H+ antiporter, TMEM165/GDT1 family